MKKLLLALALCFTPLLSDSSSTPTSALPVFNVQAYGATGNGTTDDTAAIQAAITAAQAVNQSNPPGYFQTTVSQSTVYFPKGIYNVTSSILLYGGTNLQGSHAIISIANGVTAFSFSPYQNKIDGFIFVGGATVLSMATNGGAGRIDIQDCEFQQQSVTSIQTDNNSSPVIIRIWHDTFINSSASTIVLQFPTADSVEIDNSQFFIASSTGIQIGDPTHGAIAKFTNCFFTPMTGAGTAILNYWAVTIDHCHFGGESGGFDTIISNYSQAVFGAVGSLWVIVQNSQVYPKTYPIKFYAIPNVVQWRNNTESNGNISFYFDPGIPTSNFKTLGSNYGLWDVEHSGNQDFTISGSTTASQFAWTLDRTVTQAQTLTVSDKILQIPFNSSAYGVGGNSTNATAVAAVNTFGSYAFHITSAAAGTWTYEKDFTTALSGISRGLYTAVYDVNNLSGGTLVVQFQTGDVLMRSYLLPGKNVVSVPFFWLNDGSSNQDLGLILLKIPNPQVVELSNFRLFSGAVNVNTQNTIVYGTTPPITLQWEIGDRVINSNPISGPDSWVCTVAGVPGTWAAASGSGGGGSSLQVTSSGVQITSPTVTMNFASGDFSLAAVGSTSTIALNSAAPEFIHLTSALQSGATFFTSSGTVNNLTVNSLSDTQIANGHCLQAGPGGQINDVGFGCGFGNSLLIGTQTWSGQNNWTTPAVSSFTFGVAVGSLSLTGAGNTSITEGNGFSGQIVLSSGTPTNGDAALWTSSVSIVDAGTAFGKPAGNPYDVQVDSNGIFGGYDNFSNNGTTIAITSVNQWTITNISTQSATNVFFDYTSSTMTISSMSVNGPFNVNAGLVSLVSTVTITGNFISSGTIPTVGTCGTTPGMLVHSTNNAGSITWEGATTTCGFTFSGSGFKSAPFCLANTSGAGFTEPFGVTATSATFTFSASLTGSTMTYVCVGGSGG